MAYTITKSNIKRELLDMAGKWRVWVEMPDGEWQMMKFNEKPTIAKIQPEVNKIIELKQQEKLEAEIK